MFQESPIGPLKEILEPVAEAWVFLALGAQGDHLAALFFLWLDDELHLFPPSVVSRVNTTRRSQFVSLSLIGMSFSHKPEIAYKPEISLHGGSLNVKILHRVRL